MSENKTVLVAAFSLVSVLLFLFLCNLYQPNAEIATLTLTTIFMSLIWIIVLQWGFVLLLFVIAVIVGAFS